MNKLNERKKEIYTLNYIFDIAQAINSFISNPSTLNSI